MSDNPYAAYPAHRADEYDPHLDGPERVSVFAVLSLVTALLCCIPGLGVLAIIFGVLGLIGISSSRGRLGGRPAAIVGIILGLLVTVGWIAVGSGMGSAFGFYQTNIMPPADNMVVAAYQGDVDAVRAEMTAAGASAVTDEEIIAFGEAMRAEFGEYHGLPTGFNAFMSTVGEGFQRPGSWGGGGAQGAIPIPLTTAQGGVIFWGVIDTQNPPQGVGRFQYDDAFVLMPNAEALVLRNDGIARMEARSMGLTPITGAEYLERRRGGGASPDAQDAPDDAAQDPADEIPSDEVGEDPEF